MRNILILLTSFLLLSGCAAVQTVQETETLRLADHVIAEDTTWSGEVVIKGVVVVGRKATLTIMPGTSVRFKRVDRNNDNIGDSEIRVLGRILAEGSAEKPIRFESAEPIPRPKDWSYLLIFTSGSKNRISHCEFRHGFTGLQVHFSTALIRNSLFTGNHEGLRFGRTKLTIEKNTFTGNDLAIRFTRMEGPVVIKHNEISKNRIGIFLVPSGQNIQDFFEPDRGTTPWNTGRLLITANNIHGNSWYNLSLGEKQLWDLDVRGNWWSSVQPETIRELIFDGNRNPELGKALFLPFADKPFKF